MLLGIIDVNATAVGFTQFFDEQQTIKDFELDSQESFAKAKAYQKLEKILARLQEIRRVDIQNQDEYNALTLQLDSVLGIWRMESRQSPPPMAGDPAPADYSRVTTV